VVPCKKNKFGLLETARVDVTVLRKVTDWATHIVRGLDAAGQTNRDCWIIHFILAKIDAESRPKWNEGSRELESLLKFLDRRCEEFELSKSESDIDSKVGPQHGKAKRSSHALVSMEAHTCVKCNSKEHKIYACSKFDELSVEQRRTFVKAKPLCFNCRKAGHVPWKCESKFTCKFCHNRHHSLLHADILNSQAAVTSTHSRDDERHIPSAPEDATVTISHIAWAQVATTA